MPTDLESRPTVHWGLCRKNEVMGAADLELTVMSQRGPTLLPFHKQPKDCYAECRKWRSQLTKQRKKRNKSGMRPGLYLGE